MKPGKFNIQDVIDNLEGTCHTLNDAINDSYPEMVEEDLTSEDYDQIDSQIFECEECGWWCGIDMTSDQNGVCSECFEDKDDEN